MDPSEKSDQSLSGPPYFEHNFQYYENKESISKYVNYFPDNLHNKFLSKVIEVFLLTINQIMEQMQSIAFQVGLAQYSFFRFLPPSKVLLAAQ